MSNPLMSMMNNKPQGNPLQQQLLGQLKQNNPQAYNFVTTAMQSGQNPNELANRLLKENNITGQRLDEFKKQAHQLGVPNEVLNNLG